MTSNAFCETSRSFHSVEYEKTVAKLKAKNVKNLKTMMDLVSDNNEFEMDIKTELFRLITEHADDVNGHFDMTENPTGRRISARW